MFRNLYHLVAVGCIIYCVYLGYQHYVEQAEWEASRTSSIVRANTDGPDTVLWRR